MKEYRWLYLFYILFLIIIAYMINSKYNLMSDAINSASYIATISEIYGLSIALTEIYVLQNRTEAITRKVKDFYAFIYITEVASNLSNVKDDLSNKRFRDAKDKLEKILEFYHENLDKSELNDVNSIHRINYDKINNIIVNIQLNPLMKVKKDKIADYISFLTQFKETLINMKIKFKKNIN